MKAVDQFRDLDTGDMIILKWILKHNSDGVDCVLRQTQVLASFEHLKIPARLLTDEEHLHQLRYCQIYNKYFDAWCEGVSDSVN